MANEIMHRSLSGSLGWTPDDDGEEERNSFVTIISTSTLMPHDCFEHFHTSFYYILLLSPACLELGSKSKLAERPIDQSDQRASERETFSAEALKSFFSPRAPVSFEEGNEFLAISRLHAWAEMRQSMRRMMMMISFSDGELQIDDCAKDNQATAPDNLSNSRHRALSRRVDISRRLINSTFCSPL
jgi:hypothetical protein